MGKLEDSYSEKCEANNLAQKQKAKLEAANRQKKIETIDRLKDKILNYALTNKLPEYKWVYYGGKIRVGFCIYERHCIETPDKYYLLSNGTIFHLRGDERECNYHSVLVG